MDLLIPKHLICLLPVTLNISFLLCMYKLWKNSEIVDLKFNREIIFDQQVIIHWEHHMFTVNGSLANNKLACIA